MSFYCEHFSFISLLRRSHTKNPLWIMPWLTQIFCAIFIIFLSPFFFLHWYDIRSAKIHCYDARNSICVKIRVLFMWTQSPSWCRCKWTKKKSKEIRDIEKPFGGFIAEFWVIVEPRAMIPNKFTSIGYKCVNDRYHKKNKQNGLKASSKQFWWAQ